ncbi:MAG: hypothetical protein GX444_11280 [Myxococcales bacterium]|nr:hypothetical protein [Myxococcales bacterium]
MNAQPWKGRYTGKTEALPDNFGLPIYHYRCKTTTMAILESPTAPSLVDGSHVGDGDKKRVRSYTPAEHYLRASDIKRKAATREGLSYNRQDAKHDIFAHGPDFGIAVDRNAGDALKEQAKRDLAAIASTAVAQAKEILVQIYPRGSEAGAGEMQYVYMSESPPMEVDVDAEGVIRSCNYIDDFDKRLENRRKQMIWLRLK